MSTAGASVRSVSGTAAGVRTGGLAYGVVALASAVVILAVALLLLFLPAYVHAALDASGAAATLGMTPDEVHRLSDQTVGEVLFGPGTFAIPAPDGSAFYDTAEAAHLRDVRLVLYGFLALAALSAVALVVALVRSGGAGWTRRAIGRGGLAIAVAMAVVGLVAFVAFDAVFELFHRVFFPGGNWAFDPTRERLVQLYPVPFWEITSAALTALTIGGGLAVWWLARRRGAPQNRLPSESQGGAP